MSSYCKMVSIIHAAFCEDRNRLVQGLPAWRFHRVNAPYAFQKIGDDPCILLPVNRQYSPLGVDSEDWVAYEPYASRAIRFRSDPVKVAGLWHPQPLYLFAYSPAERGDYPKRLIALANLAVDPMTALAKLGLTDGGTQ